jgi:hypothetical protein
MVVDGYRQVAVRNEAGELVAVAGAAVHVNLWKASPAVKGARRLRLPAAWNVRGHCASTSAGATRSPVMRCARRCVERAAEVEFCEVSLGILRARLIAERSLY